MNHISETVKFKERTLEKLIKLKAKKGKTFNISRQA